MSEAAIFEAAQALRSRIGDAVGGDNFVHVGPPLRSEIGESRVALFPFHLQVNSEMRNQTHLMDPSTLGSVTEPASRRDVLPLDMRFLITVFRSPDISSSTPNELTTLGQIIQALQAEPTLPTGSTGGQAVRLTLEPYPMEELSRVWGLFPQDVYRTSIVYLASPIIVEAGQLASGRPVVHREQRTGAVEGLT